MLRANHRGKDVCVQPWGPREPSYGKWGFRNRKSYSFLNRLLFPSARIILIQAVIILYCNSKLLPGTPLVASLPTQGHSGRSWTCCAVLCLLVGWVPGRESYAHSLDAVGKLAKVGLDQSYVLWLGRGIKQGAPGYAQWGNRTPTPTYRFLTSS